MLSTCLALSALSGQDRLLVYGAVPASDAGQRLEIVADRAAGTSRSIPQPAIDEIRKVGGAAGAPSGQPDRAMPIDFIEGERPT
jgi:hypothetical protein